MIDKKKIYIYICLSNYFYNKKGFNGILKR